jgi:peptidoglycan/LPS O-acetylase OafA/YrhL
MKLDLVSKTGREHILLIDVLRGVAIAGVFLFHTLAAAYGRYHFPWNGWFPQFQSVNSYLLLWPFNFGYVGVAIFFVVSGFCIHLSYLSNQNQSWIFFFKKRILRIYPLYLLALLFFFVGPIQMYPLRSGTEWWQFLSHVFAVHNFGSETYAGINPSFWSIAVEVQLYLIYPAGKRH